VKWEVLKYRNFVFMSLVASYVSPILSLCVLNALYIPPAVTSRNYVCLHTVY